MNQRSSIGILGGTGREGKGLAFRWAQAGHRVMIGSRALERAQAAASEINSRLGIELVSSGDNLSVARGTDVVVLTVPYSAHRETLEAVREALQGKLLVDVTVPLVPPKVTKVQMPLAGSAAMEAREILGESVEIADAFQNISHEHYIGRDDLDWA